MEVFVLIFDDEDDVFVVGYLVVVDVFVVFSDNYVYNDFSL